MEPEGPEVQDSPVLHAVSPLMEVVDTMQLLHENIVNFFFPKNKSRESFSNEVSDSVIIDTLMLIEDEQNDPTVSPWGEVHPMAYVDPMYRHYENFFTKNLIHAIASISDEVSDRLIIGALMSIENEQDDLTVPPLEEVQINQTLITTPTQGIQSSAAAWVSRHSIRGH